MTFRLSASATGPGTTRNEFAVSLQSVSKSYGAVVALDDVTLDVRTGEFLAILGPSGSGKTTMMRLIGGFERPDHGSVLIAGVDVTEQPPARRNVSTVFQSYALFPHLSAVDNVAYGPRMHGLSRSKRRARAAELLELVRLTGVGDRKPHQLSGGMQQRVALARALANDPSVLLLDEPLGALDRGLREEMQVELRRVQTTLGATFVYITHDQDEAFAMADRLAVVQAGRIEQIGKPAEVYDRPANAWVARFVGTANSITGTVRRTGSSAVLHTDVGQIVSGFLDAALEDGSSAVALVRPEDTSFRRANPADLASGANGEQVNELAARVVEVTALGAALRLRARTDGGLQIESRAPRSGQSNDYGDLSVGDAVTVAFEASAVRVYPPGAEP